MNGGIVCAASPASSSAAGAHRLREPPAELVDRVAHERPVGRREPRRQQLPRAAVVGEVLGTLAGQQHELEAPVRPAVARVHVRPRRIAPLARRGDRATARRRRRAQSRRRASARRTPGRRTRCRPRRARTSSRRRRRSRSGRGPSRVSSVGSSSPTLRLAHAAQRQLDVVVGLLERLGAPAAVDRGGGQRPHRPVERPLQASAGRTSTRAPTPTGRAAGMLHAEDRLAVGAEPLVAVDRQDVEVVRRSRATARPA